MSIEKLKPCPFCGCEDLFFYPDGDMEGHTIMGNHFDGCFIGTFGYETEGDAINAWNQRANQWVNCSDSMPDMGHVVAAWGCDENPVMVYRVNWPNGPVFLDYENDERISSITHWLKLVPPKTG